MRHFLEIAKTGLASVGLHPLRSFVCIVALVAVILPYLAGMALALGLEAEAEASVQFGADLYVTGEQLGRPAPIPVVAAEQIRAMDGVTAATPRIVGAVALGKDRVRAVVVGVAAEASPAWSACVEGELPKRDSRYEIVIGTALARQLNLKIDSVLPPFYRNDKEGERLMRVVGLFKQEAPMWQANLMLTSFETAALIFEQRGAATDLLITCDADKRDQVQRAILQRLNLPNPDGQGMIRPRVTTRADQLAILPRGVIRREGVFNLHFVLAIVVAIFVLLVTSGVGLTERRREIGILKATGWQTDEILLRGMAESFALSLAGACLSLGLAWLWLRIGNGVGLAGFFIAGVDVVPDFPAPFRLTPTPALLAFVLALVIVLTGTLWSAWRAATVAPREAMR